MDVFTRHQLEARLRNLNVPEETIQEILSGDSSHEVHAFIELLESYMDGENPLPTEYDVVLPWQIEDALFGAILDE